MRTIPARKPTVALQLTAAFLSLLLFSALTRAETTKKEAWQILETAIQADDPEDRATAIRALGLLPGDMKAAELAGKGLDDLKPQVRAAAAAVLGQMGASASIPRLKEALYDKDISVALAAAHALNLMRNDSAYEVYYAILTGARKGGKGLIAEQVDTLHDPKKLASIGFSEGIGFVPLAGIGWQAFRVIHKNDSSPVRATAASVLADDTDPKSGEALANAAGDKNWLVRVAALEALAKRKDPSLLSRIEASLSDSKKEVRYTAAAVVLRLHAVQEAREAK
jgi:HEAT repeat protein